MLIRRTILTLAVAAVSAGAQGTAPALNGGRPTIKPSIPKIVPKPVMVDDGTLLPGAVIVEGEPVIELLSGKTSAIALDGILNKQWRGVDSFSDKGKKFEVSITFDLAGETYLSVLAPGATVPRFFRLERSMDGRWSTSGVGYRADIAITNIFCKICNHIRIRTDSGNSVYYKKIKDLVERAYSAGSPVVSDGKEFRIYFANDLNRQATGRIVDDRYGIVVVYGKASDPKRLIVPFSELSSGKSKRYKIKNGPTVVLRIDPSTRTLFLSTS